MLCRFTKEASCADMSLESKLIAKTLLREIAEDESVDDYRGDIACVDEKALDLDETVFDRFLPLTAKEEDELMAEEKKESCLEPMMEQLVDDFADLEHKAVGNAWMNQEKIAGIIMIHMTKLMRGANISVLIIWMHKY
jgi:hypothetical protein